MDEAASEQSSTPHGLQTAPAHVGNGKTKKTERQCVSAAGVSAFEFIYIYTYVVYRWMCAKCLQLHIVAIGD